MLKMRIIPCLDVKDGRVVKGVNFVDLVDAGDPVEQARLYDREGADELMLPRHHRQRRNRDTLYDVVRRTAEQVLHAADRRRRRAHGRGYPQAAAGRRRQGVDQHRRRGPARIRRARRRRNSAASASSWRSTPKRSVPGKWEVFTHGGRRPHRHRRGRVGAPAGRLRRRRDPADLDGPRRHQVRLRHRR